MTLFIIWSKTLLSKTVLFYVFSITFYLNKIMWIIKVTSKGRCWINQEESLSHPEQLSGCLPPSVWGEGQSWRAAIPYVRLGPQHGTWASHSNYVQAALWRGRLIRLCHTSGIALFLHPSQLPRRREGWKGTWLAHLPSLLTQETTWRQTFFMLGVKRSLHVLKQGPTAVLSLGISRRNWIKKDWAAPFTSKNAQYCQLRKILEEELLLRM